jgi:A/G-specific adenine glycosylase
MSKKTNTVAYPPSSVISTFQKQVYDYFRKSGRDLPWRKTRDPYCILVSEIMLQQTQVDRVIQKFQQFITTFPDFHALHRASLAEVYAVWSGLGYNRRALALKKIAQIIVEEYAGGLPDSVEKLSELPGIGKATASAICVYAFNKPALFIETNIRTVFIHHFFKDGGAVSDAQIAALAEKALDKKNPHAWYSALMDYGTMLKREYPQLTRKSSHYSRQSPFRGSRRQIRGKLLRALLSMPGQTESMLVRKLGSEKKELLHDILGELAGEGMITCRKKNYFIG